MKIRYRFVDFGTRFVESQGVRERLDYDDRGKQVNAERLYENEIAVDVGGTCIGWASDVCRIVDHHFARKDQPQYPSAAAAVLQLGDGIRQAVQPFFDVEPGIWLVTHATPDFDAFCSMYLAKHVLGLSDAEWEKLKASDFDRTDWFDPRVAHLDEDARWAVLMAATAAVVDQGKPVKCDRRRALHSVLYAAVVRKRPYLGQQDGAVEFFDEVRRIVREERLNPLYDDVLGRSPLFGPELELLDREEAAYLRDLRRARSGVVAVPKVASWNDEQVRWRTDRPLYAGAAAADAQHHDDETAHVDAIWLRDPECLLFKEWARLDREHSSLREGFQFTAIAYSGGREAAWLNSSDYYFSLDPERANGKHLFPIWAALQKAEIDALHQPAFAERLHELGRAEAAAKQLDPAGTRCRPGYEARAGDYAALFNDPWFDGINYDFTIVVCPNRGSLIGSAGRASDLGDDPVARLVEHELEGGVLLWPAEIRDLPASGQLAKAPAVKQVDPRTSRARVAPPGTLRFVRVWMRDMTQVTRGGFSLEVGRKLYSLLEPDNGGTVPTDFETRHLVVDPHSVVVWTRQGIAVACESSAGEKASRLLAQLQELAGLAAGVEEVTKIAGQGIQTPAVAEEVGKRGADLLQRSAELKRQLAQPEGRAVRRLFEALAYGDLLDGLRDVVQSSEMSRNIATVAEVQTKVEWIEVLIIAFYSAELVHTLSKTLFPAANHGAATVAMILAGLIVGGVTAWAVRPWLAPLAFFLLLLGGLGLGVQEWINPHPHATKTGATQQDNTPGHAVSEADRPAESVVAPPSGATDEGGHPR